MLESRDPVFLSVLNNIYYGWSFIGIEFLTKKIPFLVQWVCLVLRLFDRCVLCSRYYETVSDVLNSVRKMEESLKRLKQARRTTPASPAGLSGGGMSDDDKIRRQLALDVAYLGEQVTRAPLRFQGPWLRSKGPAGTRRWLGGTKSSFPVLEKRTRAPDTWRRRMCTQRIWEGKSRVFEVQWIDIPLACWHLCSQSCWDMSPQAVMASFWSSV